MTTVLLSPLRHWLESLEISNPQLARSICTVIPARCPFARQIKCFDRTILNIPPLCKLNPLYDQFIDLRFRALTYLVDQCDEDVASYC